MEIVTPLMHSRVLAAESPICNGNVLFGAEKNHEVKRNETLFVLVVSVRLPQEGAGKKKIIKKGRYNIVTEYFCSIRNPCNCKNSKKQQQSSNNKATKTVIEIQEKK